MECLPTTNWCFTEAVICYLFEAVPPAPSPQGHFQMVQIPAAALNSLIKREINCGTKLQYYNIFEKTNNALRDILETHEEYIQGRKIRQHLPAPIKFGSLRDLVVRKVHEDELMELAVNSILAEV